MKKHFIEAKSSLGKVEFDTSGLPKKIGIVTTVQHLSDMKKVVDFLWKKEIKAVLCGQVLGCDAGAALIHNEDVDAFLYIGTGEFHPIGVALRTGKPVWVLHPDSMRIRKLEEADIERINKRKKGMLLKFHSSKTVGVLLTTKPGQSTVQGGVEKVKEIEKRFADKQFCYFICDTLNFSELENFPFVECWLNTMCPRVMEDLNVLNVEDIGE
ncbi:diphthamide synthesis protein [Candidatus Woesearchaeota archaeon]|nr:diphthamide synthesis protein [Candidatus Woesearchaeota archaeon]